MKMTTASSLVYEKKIFDEIISAANSLVNYTEQDDVLVFIGQSPTYPSYIVEKLRKVIRVPCSGRFLIDNETIPNQAQLAGFKQMLNELGLSEAIISNQHIILVDHSHSGQSISSFGKLLNLLYDLNKRYDFINIVSAPQAKDGWIMRPDYLVINTERFLIMPSLVAIANNGYPRSIPSYQYWKWTEQPNWTSQEIINGQKFISELIDYYNQVVLEPDHLIRNYDINMMYPTFGHTHTDKLFDMLSFNISFIQSSIQSSKQISIQSFIQSSIQSSIQISKISQTSEIYNLLNDTSIKSTKRYYKMPRCKNRQFLNNMSNNHKYAKKKYK
jgi:hypothetical protein